MASFWTCNILLTHTNESAEFLQGDEGLPSVDTMSQQNVLTCCSMKFRGKKHTKLQQAEQQLKPEISCP